MRTSTFKKRTLVAYEVDESSGELVVNILGVFHGGQDWEAALGQDQSDPEAGRDVFVRGKCVAGGPRRPPATNALNAFAQVSRTLPTMTTNGR